MIKPQGMRMTPRSGGCAPQPAARAVTRGRGFHRGQGGDVRARGRRQGWGGRRSTGLAAAGQGRRVQAVCGPGASAQRKLPAPLAPALRDAVPAHARSRTAPRGGGTRPRPPARPPAGSGSGGAAAGPGGFSRARAWVQGPVNNRRSPVSGTRKSPVTLEWPERGGSAEQRSKQPKHRPLSQGSAVRAAGGGGFAYAGPGSTPRGSPAAARRGARRPRRLRRGMTGSDARVCARAQAGTPRAGGGQDLMATPRVVWSPSVVVNPHYDGNKSLIQPGGSFKSPGPLGDEHAHEAAAAAGTPSGRRVRGFNSREGSRIPGARARAPPARDPARLRGGAAVTVPFGPRQARRITASRAACTPRSTPRSARARAPGGSPCRTTATRSRPRSCSSSRTSFSTKTRHARTASLAERAA
jgi:hypothetical protein